MYINNFLCAIGVVRMKGIAIFLVVVSILPIAVGVVTDWDDFGTKTAYNWAVDSADLVTQDDQDMSIVHDGKTCAAIYVNGFLRHGSRFPGADDMEDMTKLQKRINASRTAGSYEFISTWENTYPPEQEDQLVDTGRQELRDIGGRFARRFSDLFRNNIDKIKFTTSRKDRAIESGEKFYEGLTETLTGQRRTDISSNVNDTLARFYENCAYHENAIKDNAAHHTEFHQFAFTRAFLAMKSSVESRIGLLQRNETLDFDELVLLYEMCAFEKYTFNRTDWCSFLIDEDRKVMEYWTDIEDYYEKSYGNDISGPLACTALQHIFNSLDEAKKAHEEGDTETYTRAHFTFGHSETIVPLLTALELFKDDTPLKANNMPAMSNRKFKASNISPMAANVAFVLYACPGVNGGTHSYVTKLLVNEESVKIPLCNNTVCGYDQLVEVHQPKFDPCDKDALCKYPRPTSGSDILTYSSHFVLITLLSMITRFIFP